MTPSVEELLAIARRYWRSDNEYQLRGERSPETDRLQALWKQEWRRMDEWQRAGVWERLHELLLARLRAAGEIEWSRAVADSSHVQAKKGAARRARARLIEPDPGRSTTSSSTRPGSRSRGRSRAATATTSPN